VTSALRFQRRLRKLPPCCTRSAVRTPFLRERKVQQTPSLINLARSNRSASELLHLFIFPSHTIHPSRTLQHRSRHLNPPSAKPNTTLSPSVTPHPLHITALEALPRNPNVQQPNPPPPPSASSPACKSPYPPAHSPSPRT